MESPHSILKKVFGYDSFRPGQEEIIAALARGESLLAVMPTGAGKSLCYQIPALMAGNAAVQKADNQTALTALFEPSECVVNQFADVRFDAPSVHVGDHHRLGLAAR